MAYKMTTRRKLAIASWSSPKEGNIYGKISIDMTNALLYLEYLRSISKEKVTITHLVGRVVGEALAKSPDINGRIFLGKYRPHTTVDLSFLIALEGGADLGKFKISNIDHKTTVEIAKEVREGSEKLRRGNDGEFEKSKPFLRYLPTWVIRPMMWLIGYITGVMGLGVKPLGLTPYPFGACIITSIGMFGLDEGYAPPTPFARVPVYIVVTKIQDTPVVVNKQIVIRPMMNLMATVDHRFLDGYQGAQVAKIIRHYLEQEPWKLDRYDNRPFV